ncbi:MAG: extracellular solute-binding protein [Eubacteriales bacterium]
MMFNEFNEFIVISRERLVCLVPNRLSDGVYDVFLLSAPDEGEKIVRCEITVAITADNYKLELAASYFNRLNDKYRVIISDYYKYNTLTDSTAARDRLDRDLTTGAVPDIMAIDPKMDWRRYVSKGMFIDLYQLMDSDKEFNRSSILGMVLKLCEYREGLYYLPDSFYINTLITHGSSGKTSLTLSDAIAALKKLHGDDRLFAMSFTSPYQQSNGIIMINDSFLWPAACSFIDFDTASCKLDSAEFVEYLIFMMELYDADAALIKAGKYDDEWQESLSEKALSGDIIYNPYGIGRDYPNANVFAYLAYCYDNNYNIVGYPSNGKNGSLIELGNMFAVSKNANSVDGAWSFLKYYFGEEYLNMEIQSGNGIAYTLYPLPATASAFSAELEQSLNSVYGVVEIFAGMTLIAYEEYPDDVTAFKDVYTISEKAAATLTDFVSSAEVIPLKNSFIIDILKEELSSFVTGSISAQTAAERMQSRVSIYLSEQN